MAKSKYDREIEKAIKAGAETELSKLTEKIRAGKASPQDIARAKVLGKQAKTGKA